MIDAPRYLSEHPVDANEGDDLDQLTDELLRWILDERPKDHTAVVGLFGRRGGGKSSALRTLLEKARTSGRVAVPTREGKPAWLDPDLFGRHDDLTFPLLELLGSTSGDAHEEDLKRLGDAYARRLAPEHILSAERDMAPSKAALIQVVVEHHRALSRLPGELRDGVRQLCDKLGDHPDQPILLGVDDLDLHPEVALPLLEMVRNALDHPRLVIVLTAERGQLLRGVYQQLRRREPARPAFQPEAYQDDVYLHTLAGELLAKTVPFRRDIRPVPSERALTYLLAPEAGDPRSSVLSAFWSEDAVGELIAAVTLRQPEREPQAQQRAFSDVVFEPETEPLPEVGVEDLRALLPDTWRGLKALHNALLHEHASGGIGQALGLDTPGARLAGALLLAVAVRFPELELERWLTEQPGRLADAIRPLGPLEDLMEGQTQNPLRAKLFGGRMPLEVGRDRDAEDRLYLVGRLLDAVLNPGLLLKIRGSELLTVSVFADALAAADQLLGVARPSDAQAFHLDLRDLTEPGQRPSVAALRGAIEQLPTWLTEHGVTDRQGGLTVLGRAPLSLMVKLGWLLRHRRRLYALNVYGDRLTVFPAPLEPVRPARGLSEVSRSGLRWQPERSRLGPATEAVLLVDLLGRSQPSDLAAFPVDPDAMRVRLVREREGPVHPEDTPDLLRGVVQAIDELQVDLGVRTVHLGLIAPDAVALLLGHNLGAMGHIVLYEDRGSGPERYAKVASLNAPADEA
ncbi:MAG: SAVED domain-containing protein [Alphaproteobacteria bacterium]|nr:SAVED domain-containing protein [Alphaproteobacteria bacterium]